MRKADQRRRLLAGVMALAALLTLLLSAFYIAAEADHDCSGEDCVICAQLRQCEKLLCCAAALAVAAAVFAAVRLLFTARFACGFLRQTPVSARVRLND